MSHAGSFHIRHTPQLNTMSWMPLLGVPLDRTQFAYCEFVDSPIRPFNRCEPLRSEIRVMIRRPLSLLYTMRFHDVSLVNGPPFPPLTGCTSVRWLAYYNSQGFQQDPQIEPRGPVLDVIEVMGHPGTGLGKRVHFSP